MLAAHFPAAWIPGYVVDDLAAQNNTSWGSSETEVNEFAAMPTGWPSFMAVIKVIPVAKWPRTVRYVAGSGGRTWRALEVTAPSAARHAARVRGLRTRRALRGRLRA